MQLSSGISTYGLCNWTQMKTYPNWIWTTNGTGGGLQHIGFAPKNNPKIAIAAYIENSGWGGRSAASIASLAAEKYIFKNRIFC